VNTPIFKEEHLFGEIACRNNFITREELQNCMKMQQEEGKNRLLGTIMIERGCITREELRTILEIQKRNMETPVKGVQEKKADINFGVLLVKLNYLSESQVFNVIKKQAFYARKGLFFRLGEILVNENLLTTAQVSQILAYQKKQILECPQCKKQYNANIDDPQSQICIECQIRLKVPERVDVAVAEAGTSVRENVLSQKIIKNRFKIIQKLGEGSGSVYLAEDYLQNNLNIALKVLDVEPDQEERIDHIRASVEEVASLDHPYLLKFFDFGVYTDSRMNPPKMNYFLTMEYVKGEDFYEATRNLSLEDLLLYFIHVLRGMEYLHKKNRLHLNLKPSNILVVSKATQALKILDYCLDEQELSCHIYSAPEVVRGETPTRLSDIFSLGTLFYYVLAGRPAFTLEQLQSPQERKLPSFRIEEHQQAVERILIKMMAWFPEQRYQSVWKLRADFEKLCDPALILESSELRKKGLDSIFACRHKLLNLVKNTFNNHFYYHQKNVIPSLNEKEEKFFIQIDAAQGNGLSHFLLHFRQFAEDVGVYVFTGDCYGLIQQPLEPFIQVFQEISNIVQQSGNLHHLKDQVVALTNDVLRELGYFQSLRGEFQLQEHHQDIRELVCKSLLKLSDIFPFTLSIENLHLADELSFDCLSHLFKLLTEEEKKQEKEGLLVVVSYDLEALPPPYQNVLLRWESHKKTFQISLDPLSKKQIHQLLKLLLPNFQHQEELQKITQKNIFYLFEFIRFFWDSPVPIFSLPEDLNILTERRLAELSPDERLCLQWMAFYQKPISLRDLFFFTKVKKADVKLCLKKLSNFGLLKTIRWNPSAYQIRHQKHCEYFFSKASTEESKKIHKHILEWIKKKTKGALLSRIEELIWHSRYLENSKRTFDYLRLAGYKFSKTRNFHRAIQMFQQAEEQIANIPMKESILERYRVCIYEAIGDVYQKMETPLKALVSYEKIDFAKLLCDAERVRIARKLGKAYLESHQYKKAEVLFSLGFKLNPSLEERVQLHLLQLQADLNRGDYPKALENCEKAQEFCQERRVDEIGANQCKLWLAVIHYHQGAFVESLEISSQCFQNAQQMDIVQEMISSMHLMIKTNLTLGRYDQATRQIEKVIQLAKEHYQQKALLRSFALKGEFHLKVGQPQQAREYYRQALRLAEELDYPAEKFYCVLGLIYALPEDFDNDSIQHLLDELNRYPIYSCLRLQTELLLAKLHLHVSSDIPTSIETLEALLPRIQLLDEHELLWRLYYQLGILYQEQQNFKLASLYLDKAWKTIQFQWASLPTAFRPIYLKDHNRQKVQQAITKLSLKKQSSSDTP
jgi:serine/threonine protein kinase